MLFLIIALIFILVGVAAGILSILFGFGGGFFVVPVLYWGLQWLQVPHALLMHMAAGTSLMVMVFTAGNACYFHYRKNNICFEPVKKLCLGLILGTLASTYVTQFISTRYLHNGFIIYLFFIILIGVYKFIKTPSEDKIPFSLPSPLITQSFAFIAGLVATLLGVGGSTLTVPFLRNCHLPLINAVGTAALLTLPISCIGAIGYGYIGYELPHLPHFSTGFIYWPAAIGMILGSFLGVPLGSKILNHMDQRWHNPGYFITLTLVWISMLFS